jgi:hypothetical protein
LSNATAIFSLDMQFWTTRGFAIVDVNYGGSTGYGREYRQRLNGQWGVVDLQDCVNAAQYLVDQGLADPARLLITGGSAGGYTTICALTFTDVFAAGAAYFGIADLEQFGGGETHKFELNYEHTLVGPYPERADVYRARSRLLRRPDLDSCSFSRADDKVVPAVAGRAHRWRSRSGFPRIPPIQGGQLPQGGEHHQLTQRELSFCTGHRFELGDPPTLEIETCRHEESRGEDGEYHCPRDAVLRHREAPSEWSRSRLGNRTARFDPRRVRARVGRGRLSNIHASATSRRWSALADRSRCGPGRMTCASIPRRAKADLDPELSREIRASFLLAGPLLARFGRVTVRPGGDVIGRRRLDTHVHAFAALGAEIELDGVYSSLRMVSVELGCFSTGVGHGNGECVMAAVLAEGERCSATPASPHQDLCRFLVSLGAQIEYPRMYCIHGTASLEAEITTSDLTTSSCQLRRLAAAGGEVVITDVEPDDLISIVRHFSSGSRWRCRIRTFACRQDRRCVKTTTAGRSRDRKRRLTRSR